MTIITEFDQSCLKAIPDNIQVGITVTDFQGRILYYNEYASRVVDRKPEYIGMDIRSCHRNPSSAEIIDGILSEIKEGKRQEYYYESSRNGRVLAVTVSPFQVDGRPVGIIQTIVVKQ